MKLYFYVELFHKTTKRKFFLSEKKEIVSDNSGKIEFKFDTFQEAKNTISSMKLHSVYDVQVCVCLQQHSIDNDGTQYVSSSYNRVYAHHFGRKWILSDRFSFNNGIQTFMGREMIPVTIPDQVSNNIKWFSEHSFPVLMGKEKRNAMIVLDWPNDSRNHLPYRLKKES